MSWTTELSQYGALKRSELWSTDLKEILEDDLQGIKYVDWLTEFPDGDQFTIPSIGQAVSRDYVENTDVVYDAMDTGEFNFAITDYISSATYITKKAMQDSYYANKLMSMFVPSQRRAIDVRVETDIMALGAGGASGGQTVSDLNNINGAAHRFVGSNTINSKQTLGLADFTRALYALKKANVPDTNLIAIVDPSVEWVINNTTNLVNVSNNARWEGIIESGIGSGMRFLKNIYGFDVYTSNYLAAAGSGDGAETIDSVTVANGVCNMFFSADSTVLPFVGAWRQMPTVEGEYNKDKQREEFVTTARYGLKVYRPENLVVVPSDSTVVG